MADKTVIDFFGEPELLVDMGDGTFARRIVSVPNGVVASAGTATGQVNVGTSATLIVAARAVRQNLTIVNMGTVDIYIGNAGVTTATGLLLAGIRGANISITTPLAVYAVAGSTQAISYMENY
jgi:hypothetical protein